VTADFDQRKADAQRFVELVRDKGLDAFDDPDFCEHYERAMGARCEG
jgi:hypothetical protein